MRKLRKHVRDKPGEVYVFHCPGCGYGHAYYVGVEGMPSWEFNGDLEKPTFHPSLLVNGHVPGKRCHLFVTNGKIHYCGDCFHDLKGKVVDMEDVEDTPKEPE